jgi:hypothetical protein
MGKVSMKLEADRRDAIEAHAKLIALKKADLSPGQ